MHRDTVDPQNWILKYKYKNRKKAHGQPDGRTYYTELRAIIGRTNDRKKTARSTRRTERHISGG